jgi:hypothetical protein
MCRDDPVPEVVGHARATDLPGRQQDLVEDNTEVVADLAGADDASLFAEPVVGYGVLDANAGQRGPGSSEPCGWRR